MSTLKVGTIQDHTNGNNALLIDSAGRTTAPANPKFSVLLNTATATNINYTSTSNSDIPFDTIDFNIGNSIALSGGVATFTAPITGYYQFNLLVQLSHVEAAAHCSTYLMVSGREVGVVPASQNNSYRNLEDPQGGIYQTSTTSALIQLDQNQTVNPQMYISTDTGIGVRQGTRFNGFLVP